MKKIIKYVGLWDSKVRPSPKAEASAVRISENSNDILRTLAQPTFAGKAEMGWKELKRRIHAINP